MIKILVNNNLDIQAYIKVLNSTSNLIDEGLTFKLYSPSATLKDITPSIYGSDTDGNYATLNLSASDINEIGVWDLIVYSGNNGIEGTRSSFPLFEAIPQSKRSDATRLPDSHCVGRLAGLLRVSFTLGNAAGNTRIIDEAELAAPSNESVVPSGPLYDVATKTWVYAQNFLTQHQPIKTINGQPVVGSGDIVVAGADVVDNLNSTSTTKALSAKQGSVLKGLVDAKADSASLAAYLTQVAASQTYATQSSLAAGLATKADTTSVPSKTSDLTNDSGFLTQHQSLKTINGQSVVGSGNIEIQGGGISEAPLDGSSYMRKNGAWVAQDLSAYLTSDVAAATYAPISSSTRLSRMGFKVMNSITTGWVPICNLTFSGVTNYDDAFVAVKVIRNKLAQSNTGESTTIYAQMRLNDGAWQLFNVYCNDKIGINSFKYGYVQNGNTLIIYGYVNNDNYVRFSWFIDSYDSRCNFTSNDSAVLQSGVTEISKVSVSLSALNAKLDATTASETYQPIGNYVNSISINGSAQTITNGYVNLLCPDLGTLTNQDLNNVVRSGIYNAAGSNTCTNTPVAAGNAFGIYVHLTAGSVHYVHQTFYDYFGSTFTRFRKAGTWSAWEPVVTQTALSAKLDATTAASTYATLSTAQTFTATKTFSSGSEAVVVNRTGGVSHFPCIRFSNNNTLLGYFGLTGTTSSNAFPIFHNGTTQNTLAMVDESGSATNPVYIDSSGKTKNCDMSGFATTTALDAKLDSSTAASTYATQTSVTSGLAAKANLSDSITLEVTFTDQTTGTYKLIIDPTE